MTFSRPSASPTFLAVLVLPDSLLDAVRLDHKGYRIATLKDMGKGSCTSSGRTGSCPFAAWGEFDAGGSIEIALILLSADSWKLLVFNGPNARGHSCDQGDGTEGHHMFQHDAIGLSFAENAQYYLMCHRSRGGPR